MKSLFDSKQTIVTTRPCQTQSIDSTSEELLNDLARIAAHICATPVALISFIEDNQMWLKARVGLDVTEINSVLELCSVVVPRDGAIVIPDMRIDERCNSSSVVTSHPDIRFY
ncbi:MAG: hypothetical protein F6K47_06910, partial [Symploca sp. SIO2E6]|nr:hypothetical protein [Symploca sp. SIO2E6]